MAIFNFLELEFLRAYPSIKPHILFNSQQSSYLAQFQMSGILKSIMAVSRPFWIRSSWNYSGVIDIWHRLWYETWKLVEWISSTRKFDDRKTNQGHRGHRKVKCELNQALVIFFSNIFIYSGLQTALRPQSWSPVYEKWEMDENCMDQLSIIIFLKGVCSSMAY